MIRSLASLFLVLTCDAQTTLGLITGKVIDQVNGAPLRAEVTCQNMETQSTWVKQTEDTGEYSFPLLPPGSYRLTVTAGPEYRSAQLYNITVPVAGFVEQDFQLRLLTDLWQSNQPKTVVSKDGRTVLPFYGPDVDTSRNMTIEESRGISGSLEPSISQVVSPDMLSSLPLAGRDVYAMITLQPGVTSDTSTTRGLGVSVNGQRPSSGSYLLDGVENNNYLITGSQTILAPEAIQEYRISTNNFSAEYGRTSGFLANAVTRSGGTAGHGEAYWNFKNEDLNANDSRRNTLNETRLPMRESQIGLLLTGPTPVRGLFESTLVEHSFGRAWEDARKFAFPPPTYISGLNRSSQAYRILSLYPAPPADSTGLALLRKPDEVNRTIAIQRLDWAPASQRDRLFGRLSVYRQDQPDFIWSPYTAFSSSLDSNSTSVAVGDTHVFSNRLTGEIHANIVTDLLGWQPPSADVPALVVPGFTLPGTAARYFFLNRGKSREVNAELALISGGHTIKAGGGWLGRSLDATLTEPNTASTYIFRNLVDLSIDSPSSVTFETTRVAPIANRYVMPEQGRSYSYNQSFAFAQDSVRVNSRLLLHVGARYEFFGAPVNLGANKDWLIRLGEGNSFAERLIHSTLSQSVSGDQRLYDTDPTNWAARAGFSLNLQRNGTSIFRGSYGIFYDRPFDNLWLDVSLNNAVPASATIGARIDYTQPVGAVLANRNINRTLDVLPLTFYQPGIRTPYSHAFFAGIQQAITSRWSLDLNYSGSLGRRLLTTDLVNRRYSTCVYPGTTSDCRYNPTLPDDFAYVANQGASSYHALIVSSVVRFRSAGLLGVNYTWSHAIDNQTEPLAGLAANLEVTSTTSPLIQARPAGFTEQFNSRIDRGNSDFDERHNLTFYSYWKLPARAGRLRRLSEGWQVSAVGAVRSGQPYTVFGSGSSISSYIPSVPGTLNYNRANLVEAGPWLQKRTDVNGGVQLVSPALFANPVMALGNTGRNAFPGPGFYSIDVSLSHSHALPFRRETARLVLRADVYNALNHANLGNPAFASTFCCGASDDFAVARYGRQDRLASVPVVSSFSETARQLQLMLRIVF